MPRLARHTTRLRRAQRGVALLALLAIIILGSAWFLTSQLNAASSSFAAQTRTRNAAVLNRAKQALIGYVAAQASKAGENNPGSLPCPENPGDFYSTTGRDGLTGTGCGSSLKVGRFPWRTIGVEKLVDASGEPLWYVVSTNWGVPTGSNSVINSDSIGQLTVDGIANNAVALIIAPGPAFRVAASGICSAWTQTRDPSASSPVAKNYLECENAIGSTFVTTGPSGSFNDQVVKITAADILPGIEAAIADRIEREVAAKLLCTYTTAIGGSAALLPLAISFQNPVTNALSGSAATQGLLPLSYAESTPGSGTACTPGAAPDYCAPNFVRWSGTPNLTITGGPLGQTSSSCSVSTVTVSASPPTEYTKIDCTAYAYNGAGTPVSASISLQASAINAGGTLRQFNTAVAMTGIDAAGRAASAALDTSGTAVVTLTASAPVTAQEDDSVCGIPVADASTYDCYRYTVSVPIFLFADHGNVHTFLDTGSPDTSWFLRNKWHLVSYYAVAAGVAPGGSSSCTTASTCLNVTYHVDNNGVSDDGKQRAILILAGRALSGQTRSGSSALGNWLEGANAGGISPFELRSATLTANRTFNDRIAVLSSN